MLDNYYRVWSEVYLDSIRNNIISLKAGIAPGTKACAVIKADGYGHGAVPIAKAADDILDFYAVATINEALNLRAHEVFKPILIIGFVHRSGFNAAIENDIRLTVFDYKTALEINEAAKKKGKNAIVHLKLDTGMNRIGFPCNEDGLDTAVKICSLENITVEGIFTHMFAADEEDKSQAGKQIDMFSEFTDKLADKGYRIPVRHCANSAGTIDMPESNFDMVRLGIALYGLYPSEAVTSLKLEPSLSWKSHIVMLKEIEAGSTVGYGATFTAKRKTRIATISVGYADGYPRNLSNKGYVLINGQKAPVAGRVCMDYIMADVTDINDVSEGDEVVLVGKQGDLEITVEELSALCGRFNYEFVCDISKRVPRVYFRNNSVIMCKDYFFDIYN